MIWAPKSGPSGGVRPIIRISTIGIALGVAVMILSLSIVTGFQQEIRSKVVGFGGHIQIRSYSLDQGLDDAPISIDQPFYPHIQEKEGVENIQVFANKAGILKTEDALTGVLVKGIGSDFNRQFFNSNMVEGRFFTVGKEALNDSLLI